MGMESRLLRALVLAASFAVLGLQAGCGKDSNATAQDVSVSVNQKLNDKKFKEAREEGEAYLRDHGDPNGQIAWALAKASAQLGEADLAASFASRAISMGAVTGVDLMTEPLLEPVRTDIRIVSLAGGIQRADPAAVAPVSVATESSAGNVSVKAGMSASAGDVSVTLPD